MNLGIVVKISKIVFEMIVFPSIILIAALLILNFVCKNAKKIAQSEQTLINA